MSESRNLFDPEPATGDPFLDAVLGLESLGRRLDALIEPPPARPDAGAQQAALDAQAVQDAPRSLAACDPPAKSTDAPPGDALRVDAMLGDALLGLVSLRHTVRLLVAALCGEADPLADRAVTPEAAWQRDLLR